MALDFYSDEIIENLAKLKPVQDVEPGVFENFVSGTGRTIMQGFAEAGRAVSMAGSVPYVLADKITGGTVMSDRYFASHDEIFHSAVDRWTPKPNEVGVAGQVAGKLLSMLPMIMAGPGGVTTALAATSLGTAEDLVRKNSDVSAAQAVLVGSAQAAGLATGIWMPVLGQNLAQRVLLGGAGFNVVQGVATREISSQILSGTKAAKEFEAFDLKALTIDVLLGLAFGGIAHYVPGQRQQGAEAWGKIAEWAKNLKPSEIDALLVLREGQHINSDSLPGKPATPADVSAHVDRVRMAIDQLASDRPVNVESIKVQGGTNAEDNVQVRGADKGQGAEVLPGVPRGSGEEVSQAAQADADRAVQGQRQELRGSVPASGEAGQAAMLLRESGQPDASRELRQAAGSDVDVQGMPLDAARADTTRDPLFIADPVRQAEAERTAIALQEIAQRVRIEEGLPRETIQQVIPPKDITPLAPLEQARAVGQHIERLLLDTGMHSKEATANAAIWEAFAKSAYERYGIPPSELLTKYGVDVRRMDSADKLLGALEQRYNQINTPEFKRWFGNSKVVDAEGKPLVVYHGTQQDFDAFQTSKRPKEPGIFFATKPEIASMYSGWDPQGNFHADDIGSVLPVYLKVDNPLLVDFAGAKTGRPEAIRRALEGGHDGVLMKNHYDAGDVQDQWVVFKPEQIKSAIGNRGTFDPNNPNILFQSSKVTESPAFQRWFEGSVITESGQPGDTPKRLYHGTKRLDRMGPKIDPKRATSGPMPYFTDDPALASKYATNKQDTSLALEDATNYEKWFRVKVPGARNPVDLDRAWFSLSPEQKAIIAERAPQIGKSDDGSEIVMEPGNTSGIGGYDQHIKEARGNHLKALMEEWLTSGDLYNNEIEFMQVLKMAGVDMTKVEMHDPWAEFPGVLPVFMSMKNPLRTDALTPEVVDALEEAVKRTRPRRSETGDVWDKNRQSPKEWVASLKGDLGAGDNSYVWTSIPDRITAELKKLGFDGIIDTGGKGGGPGHTVYIPFGTGQVKSAIGNRGTFDPDSANVLYQDQPNILAHIRFNERPPAQPGFDITPALREKAMAGVPLLQGGARGSATSFGQTGQSLIHLFENADKSTFQHETGHVFLEMTRDMAMRYGVPVGAVQDWATLAKWLGIEGGPITREAHEKFARGWEKYLAEGVAPNEGLKGAFKRFRDWMIDVYKSLTNMDVDLNNQVRGVMARMLESQAKDPISKGGLEDPRLTDPEYRTALDMMARNSGWAEEGGRIIRDPMTGEVSGRTLWIAHEEWYQRLQQNKKARLPGGRKGVERAVQKAVMGEPMNVQEKRAVTWMLDEHKMLVDHWNESGANIHPDGDPFEIANLQNAEGIEPTAKNTLDMALIDRARQVDPDAFENIPTGYDDATFMAAVKEIVDANKPEPQKADQGGEEAPAETEHVGPQSADGATGSPPPPSGGADQAAGGAAARSPLENEVLRIIEENPDGRVVVGKNPDGSVIYKTYTELLNDELSLSATILDEIPLVYAAAECLIGAM